MTQGFKSLLEQRLDQSFENNKFEDGCRMLMGNRAYMLFTLDKVCASTTSFPARGGLRRPHIRKSHMDLMGWLCSVISPGGDEHREAAAAPGGRGRVRDDAQGVQGGEGGTEWQGAVRLQDTGGQEPQGQRTRQRGRASDSTATQLGGWNC